MVQNSSPHILVLIWIFNMAMLHFGSEIVLTTFSTINPNAILIITGKSPKDSGAQVQKTNSRWPTYLPSWIGMILALFYIFYLLFAT